METTASTEACGQAARHADVVIESRARRSRWSGPIGEFAGATGPRELVVLHGPCPERGTFPRAEGDRAVRKPAARVLVLA